MKKILFFICIINFHISKSQTLEEKIAEKTCECLDAKPKITDDVHRDCITKSMTEVVFADKDIKNREAINTVDGIKNLFRKINDILPETCDNLKEEKSEEKKTLFYSKSQNENAQNAYIIAKDLMSAEKYELAIEGLLMSIKSDTNFVLAYDDLAVCYRQLKEYDKAIKYYKKSLEIYPEGNFALMNIAVVYSLKSDFKTAIEYYEKLKKYHPKDAEGYFGAGKNYFLSDDYEKALNNIFIAHRIYTNEKSDYIKDSEQLIRIMYQKLKQENKEDLFRKIAENNDIKLN